MKVDNENRESVEFIKYIWSQSFRAELLCFYFFMSHKNTLLNNNPFMYITFVGPALADELKLDS